MPFVEPKHIHPFAIPTEPQQPQHSWVSIAMLLVCGTPEQPRNATPAQPCKSSGKSTLKKPTWIELCVVCLPGQLREKFYLMERDTQCDERQEAGQMKENTGLLSVTL